MDTLSQSLHLAVAAHGIGSICAILEDVAQAHVIHIERARHVIFVKGIFPKLKTSPVSAGQEHCDPHTHATSERESTSTGTSSQHSSPKDGLQVVPEKFLRQRCRVAAPPLLEEVGLPVRDPIKLAKELIERDNELNYKYAFTVREPVKLDTGE